MGYIYRNATSSLNGIAPRRQPFNWVVFGSKLLVWLFLPVLTGVLMVVTAAIMIIAIL
jgi:hypothetical protein